MCWPFGLGIGKAKSKSSCCSHRCGTAILIIDFLFRDSILYYIKVTVDEQVFKTFKSDRDLDGLSGRVNVSVMDGAFALCTPIMAHPVGSTSLGYLNKRLRSFIKDLCESFPCLHRFDNFPESAGMDGHSSIFIYDMI